MINKILKFVQDNYKPIGTILGIIAPSLFTFVIDRQKRFSEQRLKIQEQQFNKVYFPLYLLAEQYLQEPINKRDLREFLQAANQIKSENIPLVHKRTVISLNKLSLIAKRNHINNKEIMMHKKIILHHYDRLRAVLCYPSSPGEYFCNLTPIGLFPIYLYILFLSLAFLFIKYAFNAAFEKNYTFVIVFSILSFADFLAIYITNKTYNS